MEEHSQLFNGREHAGYYYKIKGHAYFSQPEKQIGVVWYNGTSYNNLPIFYDTYKDELVLSDMQRLVNISLPSQAVNRFSILNHTFIRLEGIANMPDGYYDVLSGDTVQVLAKRKKNLLEKLGEKVTEREFIQDDSFYIYKNGAYFPVKNRRAVLKVFMDKKAELQQYIRKSQLNVRDDFEKSLVDIVEYYKQLTSS
ncbi:MAG TPA: hypothetical protein VEV16_11180 [Daejeonella sp.]|nr:hypothetical protein [Daejeonella sp.]